MVSINTNLSSLIAQRSLTNSTQLLNEAIERMSTGFQINGAKDNAANYAISTNMSTRISSYEVAVDNAATALDLVSTASSSLDQINDHLSRLRSLATQAGNGTYGEQSLNAINQEANAIIDEIERLYGTTSFNGISLFNKQTNNVVTNSVNRLSNSVRIVTPEIQTKSLSSTPKVLSETEEIEAEADESTSFDELGINGGSFGVYNSAGDLQNEYTLEGLDTIGKFIELLNNSGFEAKIENGVISVKSDDGSYISGALADSLGIEVTNSTQTTGASTSSTLSVTYTETVTASTSTTFGELGATGNLTGIIYDETNSACNTITVKTTDTIGDMISKLAANNITATIKNGVVSLSTNNKYVLGGALANILDIQVTQETQLTSITASMSCYHSNVPENDLTATGTTMVPVGEFKLKVNHINTDDLISISEAFNNLSGLGNLDSGTYKISTTEDLQTIYDNRHDFEDGSYTLILANNIDCNGQSISLFSNLNRHDSLVFDGNGYVISNLSLDVPFFSTKLANMTIKNLGFENIELIEGTDWGVFAGTMTNVSIENCFISGTFNNNNSGLADTIENSTISNSYVSGTFMRNGTGFASFIKNSTVRDCFTTGSMLYGEGFARFLQNSYVENVTSDMDFTDASGNVGYSAYGFFEYVEASTVRNAYFSGTRNTRYGGDIAGYVRYNSLISKVRSDDLEERESLFRDWNNNILAESPISELGITSGNVGVYKGDEIIKTITIDSTSTCEELAQQLKEEGFRSYLSDIDAYGNVYCSTLTVSSADMTMKSLDGNSSNIADFFSFRMNYKTIYENTTSAVQNVVTSKSLTETSELQDLPDYNNGNGEISVVQSDGTKTTIKVSPTDTIGTLFSKLSQFGIVGSLNSGLVSLESTNGAYIEQAAGGSNLFDSLNLKPVEIEKEEIPVNTDSDKLTVTTPSGGDGDGGTDPVDPDGGNQGGGTNPPTDPDGGNSGSGTTPPDPDGGNSGSGTTPPNPDGGNTGGGTKPPTDPDGGNNTGSGGSGNQGGNNGNGGGNTGGISPITPAPDSIIFQVGIDSDWSSQIGISTSFELTGLDELRNIGIDDKDYLSQIDNLLSTVNAKQTEFGAAENRLMSVLEEISIHYDNLVSSRSTLRDADIAEVSSEYIRQQILQQASATLLSTANQTPAIALRLL